MHFGPGAVGSARAAPGQPSCRQEESGEETEREAAGGEQQVSRQFQFQNVLVHKLKVVLAAAWTSCTTVSTESGEIQINICSRLDEC